MCFGRGCAFLTMQPLSLSLTGKGNDYLTVITELRGKGESIK